MKGGVLVASSFGSATEKARRGQAIQAMPMTLKRCTGFKKKKKGEAVGMKMASQVRRRDHLISLGSVSGGASAVNGGQIQPWRPCDLSCMTSIRRCCTAFAKRSNTVLLTLHHLVINPCGLTGCLCITARPPSLFPHPVKSAMASSKASSGTQTLLKHYSRLFRAWPSDSLRPISFHNSIRKRLQVRFLAPTAAAAPTDSVTPSTSAASSTDPNKPWAQTTSASDPSKPATSDARAKAEQTAANIQGSGKPGDSASSPLSEKVERIARLTPAEKEKDELEQANALYSLLENRYSKSYPCSENLMRPASNEGYYAALAREMEEAPSRSWWMQKWIRWRGIVRFS